MAKSTAQSKKSIQASDLIKAYKIHFLNEGKQPPSVFRFMDDLGSDESTFYNYFGSFDGLEQAFWKEKIEGTLEVLEKDKTYVQFSIREKLLAFYFTHFEQLRSDRSFILLLLNDWKEGNPLPRNTQEYRNAFDIYIKALIEEGIERGEIVDRKYLTDKYHRGFWIQFLFVLNFWKRDQSAGFENTDAAIEKAVNLSFELIGRGPLESMIDFAKFVFQNR